MNTSSDDRILVVDDDNSTRVLLEKVLSRKYTVDSASELSDALDLLDTNEYALVITDLCLGYDSGITLARDIFTRNLSTEVIIITGHGSDSTASEAVVLGVTHYLQKPIDISELDSLVTQALHTRAFTIKSSELVQSKNANTKEVQNHLENVLGLYSLLQRLSRTISIEDTVAIFLQSVMASLDCPLGVVGVNVLGVPHLYVVGSNDVDEVNKHLVKHWDKGAAERSGFTTSIITDGRAHFNFLSAEKASDLKSCCSSAAMTPLASFGDSFGFVALFGNDIEGHGSLADIFYTLIPVITPMIYRGVLEEKIKQQAKTDGLTGIANRRMLEEVMDRDIQQVIRHDRIISFVMIDIDDFKMINDVYGHLVGDNILKDLAKQVNLLIRGSDLFARYGGEEFALILPETDLEGALQLSERIRNAIEQSVHVEGDVEVRYTISMGVTTYEHTKNQPLDNSEHSMAIEIAKQIILEADEALYAAKRGGKNRVVAHKGVL